MILMIRCMNSDLITRYRVDASDFNKKTADAKKALDQFGLKGTEVGNAMGRLTQALNVNVGAMSKMAVGLGAASAALKVAGDALKKNELVMDEWNRNVEAARSVYDGFLNALNTGDISGFLSNMDTIVKAARAAYDAMDELGTFNAFNQINVERTKTGFNEAMADFKAGTGDKAAVEAAARAMKEQLAARQKLEEDAYVKAIESLAANRGVDAEMLKKAMSGSYGDYRELKEMGLSKTEMKPYYAGQFMGTQYQAVKVAANDQERLGEMLRKLNDTELQSLQALGAQAQRTATEVSQVDKQVARYLKESESKTGGGKAGRGAEIGGGPVEGTIRYYQTMIGELGKKVGDAVDADVREQLNNTIRIAKEELDRMQTGENTWKLAPNTAGVTNTAGDMLGKAAQQLDTSGVQKAAEDWERYRASLKAANAENEKAYGAIGAVGDALQGLDSPAAKVMGIIAEAVANIALTFAKSLKGTVTPWDWIAGAAAGTATMITTISAIKSATRFANGGEIKGNRYSGDQQFAAVNAGEYVFNRAQLGNLASQLQGNDQGREMQPYLQAEMIYIGLSNYLKRTGKGEIVTTMGAGR